MASVRKLLVVASLLAAMGCGSPTYKRDGSSGVMDADNASKTYESSAGKGTPATGTDAGIATGVALAQSALQSGKNKKNAQNKILGQCVIANQGTELPCASILLVLKKIDGQMVLQERTQMDGSFLFSVKTGEEYKIEPQSSGYKVEKDSASSFKAGSKIKLRLQSL